MAFLFRFLGLGKGYGVIPSSGAVSGGVFGFGGIFDLLRGVLGKLPWEEVKFGAPQHRIGAFDKQAKANGAGLLGATNMGL